MKVEPPHMTGIFQKQANEIPVLYRESSYTKYSQFLCSTPNIFKTGIVRELIIMISPQETGQERNTKQREKGQKSIMPLHHQMMWGAAAQMDGCQAKRSNAE